MNVPSSYLSEHTTERLHIRPLTIAHAEPWTAFLSDKQATRYFPAERSDFPAQRAVEWIESQLQRYNEGRFGVHALHLDDGTFIGQCGLITQEVDNELILEIGYHLFTEHTGKGYATEAARYFREYAAQERLAEYVASIIREDNYPSQAVARRNGMQPWKHTTWRDLPVIVFRAKL